MRTQRAPGPSRSLETRLSDRKSSIRPYCDHCRRPGHWTSKCRKIDTNKCWNCGKPGHRAKECWLEKRDNGKTNGKAKGMNESNLGEEEIVFTVDEEYYNFDTFDKCNVEGMDERLILYDWLADTATTSHITHQREALTNYTPSEKSSVTGVGGNQAAIAGKGTVELVSTCRGRKFNLILQNVLHVPGTRNNIILLG